MLLNLFRLVKPMNSLASPLAPVTLVQFLCLFFFFFKHAENKNVPMQTPDSFLFVKHKLYFFSLPLERIKLTSRSKSR